MALAIFDLDNTLLAGDSDHAWGQYLVERERVSTEAHQAANDYFYRQYQAGTLDIHEYVEFVVSPLQAMTEHERQILRNEFMEDVVAPMIAPGAPDLLQRHREQGDELIIITATIDFITRPIAEHLGIPHLIATLPETTLKNGETVFTGRIQGTPAFQHGKIKRLNAWLAEQPTRYDTHWFYSDSHNDLPLLCEVDHPVAVDPDDSLRREAEARVWPILSLR